MPSFFVRNCVRCGTRAVVHNVHGEVRVGKPFANSHELAAACASCRQFSIYTWGAPAAGRNDASGYNGNIEDYAGERLSKDPVRIAVVSKELSEHIPNRVTDLFREANECLQMNYCEAAGSMFRKALDVATKHIYSHDVRLDGKEPAQALRARIKSMGEMGILEADIVELADVAALDGNDAAHDIDPYSREEAEALEDLTLDLLDRLFVRPAKIAAVKAKQIAAGVRRA